jgi:hypothetical protein
VAVLEDVVDVPDLGVAERVPAGATVADVDQLREPAVEPAPFRVAADERAVVGHGEQPSPPRLALAAGEDVAHDAGRHRSVPGDVCGAAGLRVGQGVDRQDDPDLDVHIGGGGLSGDPFDQGVGHDLVPGALVAGGDQGIGVAAQCRVTRHPLLDGQVPGQQGHGVRGGADGDPPIPPLGAAAA